MTKRKKCILALLTVLLLKVAGFSQTSGRFVTPDVLSAGIENAMEDAHISGLGISVFANNATVFQKNFGWAKRVPGVMVDDSTIFLMYSVTKTITGIALMQLLEDGFFDLDDSINSWLPFHIVHPGFPASPVTFRMLLCHTSGIRDNWSVINGLSCYNHDSPVTISGFIQDYLLPGGSYYHENLSFNNHQPGTFFEYSNAGATLAGLLVETISGMPYHQYIRDNILLPLGMTRSGFYLSELDTVNMAREYSYSGGLYHTSGFYCNPLLPAGFLRSSITDMGRYLSMLIHRGTLDGVTILDSLLFESMITVQLPAIAPNSGYFFGFDDINGLWGHSGGFNGVKTLLFFDKENDWGVTVLSNGSGEPWQIAYMLYQYAQDYESLSPLNISVEDQNHNCILESCESATIQIFLRNNMPEDFPGGTITLSCQDPSIQLPVFQAALPLISEGDTSNVPVIFQIETGNLSGVFNQQFTLHYIVNNVEFDSAGFSLPAGLADILIVQDEEHLYRNRANAVEYYSSAIASHSFTTHIFDMSRMSLPDYHYLLNYSAVVWFTGLDNEEIQPVFIPVERELLAGYLDNGGNLFISSQNLSDAISQTSFFTDYMHAAQVNPDFQGDMQVEGINGTQIGNELSFFITGGDGTGTQYSPSSIEPVNGAELIFAYTEPGNGAGICFDGSYKLVFLPFCFAAIADQSSRTQLMERILAFFGLFSGLTEKSSPPFSIFPNPVAGNRITIEYPGNIFCNLIIYNMNGEKLKEYCHVAVPGGIDISDLEAGFYVIKLCSEKEMIVRKITIL